MPHWLSSADIVFLGNDVGSWVLAAATFLVTFTILPIVRGFVSARRRRWAERQQHQVHHTIELTALLIERTSTLFLWAAALYLGSRHLTFPARLERLITIVVVVSFWVQMALWGMTAVRFAIDRHRKRSPGLDAVLASSMEVLLFAAGLLIWSMALLLALDNLGIEIKPLLAGLGIGGIAVALAVQTVLGDLLASMSIALDKPFAIGDFLTLGDCQGTVEHIGVKSTRLRALSGEQIIMANADILKTRIRNFGRMRERRAVFQFGVDYQTPAAVLAGIPAIVRELAALVPNIRFDRCHFLTYGDTALQFEVVFYVASPDFAVYADAQQALNLALLERFAALDIRFAALTRTLVFVENPGRAGSPQG